MNAPQTQEENCDLSSIDCSLSKTHAVSVLLVSTFIFYSLFCSTWLWMRNTAYLLVLLPTEEANRRQKSCCGFYLILFITFALPLCFLFNCDDCLLLNMRFAVQSAPESHQQADKLVVSSHHYYNWPVRIL